MRLPILSSSLFRPLALFLMFDTKSRRIPTLAVKLSHHDQLLLHQTQRSEISEWIERESLPRQIDEVEESRKRRLSAGGQCQAFQESMKLFRSSRML
ncbi:hypothetical protein KOR42_10870 [Thalassoglobus neptunius]|uniref:Uncharacterized protein n=1 Tax=Thalassoglobus neptunius TaxID=1938619 RepID=A0A5C5X5W4_9PLAN|nr:hypothetical protein KOR42_10870 [Thalassoglobus neptunius]